MACALPAGGKAPRPLGHASGSDRSGRARATAPDAVFAAGFPACAPPGVPRGVVYGENGSLCLHQHSRCRHCLHRLGASARTRLRSSVAAMARRVLGLARGAVSRGCRASRTLVFRHMGVDAPACRGRVVMDCNHVARAYRRSAALARETRETRESPCPHSLAKFALRGKRRFGVGRDHRAGRCRQPQAETFGSLEMDRCKWPHSRARFSGQCAPGIGLGRSSITGGGSRGEAQRVAWGGLVGRNGQSHSARLSRKCAPRVNLGRGSIAGGSVLDEAQHIERRGLVGRQGQSDGGARTPRIDLGRGSLAGGSSLDEAQRIERRGLVGGDGQRSGASTNRREPRELFLGFASDARHLERDLRRHGPGCRAYRQGAHCPAKHRAHLFRTEAARFSFASRELDPRLLISSNAGRASP